MDYVSIAEGRRRPGLRLVLSAGVPGPWGESAKAVLNARSVPFTPVAQTPMAENEDLRAWTGVRNAPVAILDDEPPLTGWRDILLLAERLGTGPSLLPADPADRAACLAIGHELCGEDGFGWNRRLSIMASLADTAPPATEPPYRIAMLAGYGLRAEAVAEGPARTAAILRTLAARLRAGDGEYLVGDALSAADLYWACFSAMVAPLPQEVNPMPAYLRPLYETFDPVVGEALDPILLAHRDRIFQRHIGLPLDY